MTAGGPVSDPKPPPARGNYDPARRRRSLAGGRRKGCWIYIPGAELAKAGLEPGSRPWYRIWGGRRGGVVVRLYREGAS